jgi:hypothetical protein
MFLAPDDYVIIMDLSRGSEGFLQRRVHNTALEAPEDLIKLRDSGARTTIQYLFWALIEQDRNQYRWDEIDQLVANCDKAGLKTILTSHNVAPGWTPDDWHCRFQSGTTDPYGGTPYRVYINPWNKEAMDYSMGFYKILMERYPHCLVTQANFLAGECLLWNTPAFFDRYCQESFRNMFPGEPFYFPGNHTYNESSLEWLRRGMIDYTLTFQRVLNSGRWHECWDACQPLLAGQAHANGNFAIEDCYKAWRAEWPDYPQFLIQYTYWMHPQSYKDQIKHFQKDLGVNIVMEAEYPWGLKDTAPASIKEDFFCMIMAPTHPFWGATSITPDVESAMRDACKLWEEYKSGRNNI